MLFRSIPKEKSQDKPQPEKVIPPQPLLKTVEEKPKSVMPNKEIPNSSSQYILYPPSTNQDLYKNQINCLLYGQGLIPKTIHPLQFPPTPIPRPIFNRCSMHVAIAHYVDREMNQNYQFQGRKQVEKQGLLQDPERLVPGTLDKTGKIENYNQAVDFITERGTRTQVKMAQEEMQKKRTFN